MTEDEMNRFIASLSLATPEPEFNVRNLPSAPSYRSLQPDTGMFVVGGGERDVSNEYRNFGISPGFRAGPISGSATVSTGSDMPTPGVGYSVNAQLPGGFNAGYRRMHAMEAPSRYDQHMLSLAREVLGSNVSGSVTEQDGRRGFGAGVSRPLGGGGNAFINAQRDPRGGHAIMGGMDMRFSRGGYADGGDAEVQSNGMPVISDGQVNWGDSSNAADFVRADQAMRAMRSAPAAPEPQAAPMPTQSRAPAPAPYSAPRDVPLPPVRPANLGQPVFQNSSPEGPGAYNPDDGFPARPPGQYADPAMLFDPDMMAKGFTPPLEAPSAPPPASPPPPTPPGASDWRRGPFPQEGGGKYTNRAMPLTPPVQTPPSTDELLALLSNPTKSVASAAIDQAAPAAKFTDRAAPGISMTPQQRDLIIRTIAAESSGKTPEEGQGIAHVIMNRIMSGRYGKTPERVLFAPKQFEPWADPRGSNYPMRHKPGMAKYEKAQAALDAAMGGDDITGGATLFWGPKSQAALGRPAPKWGRTGGLDIGETRFHREEGGAVEEREGHAGGNRVVSTVLEALRARAIPRVNPTEAADRVAFLLRNGRGNEVTNELAGAADPNTLLQHYLSGGTGAEMPMGQAARIGRAKEMGYHTEKPYYHAGDPKTAFDNSRGELYVTTDKPFAEAYRADKDYGDIRSLLSRHQNTIEGDDVVDFFHNKVSSLDPSGVNIKYGWQAFNPDHLAAAGGDPRDAAKLLPALKREGFDSAFFPEDFPPTSSYTDPSSSRAIFYPETLRDISARFDPRLPHVSDLGYASGGTVERALHLARGGYATQGGVDGQPDEEYSDGARPLTIYRGERPDAAAGPVDTRGPTSHARYQATLGQLGRFEDAPPMDPAVMGQNWANAVKNYRNSPPREGEPTMSARTPSIREQIGDFIAGDDQFNHASMIRQRLAQLAVGEGGQGGMGVGALDFVPFAGGALNATDISHQLGEGDYLGAGISAAMTALPFAGRLAKPAMDYGRRAVDVAKQYAPQAGAAVGAGAVLAPEEAEAAKAPKIVQQALRAIRGNDLIAKDPRIADVVLSKRDLSGSDKLGMRANDVEYSVRPKNDLRPWQRFNPEDMFREQGYVVPALGDRSAAGRKLEEINGVKLTSPSDQQGGGEFKRSTEDPAVWASRTGMVTSMQGQLDRAMAAQGVPQGAPVFMSHTLMGYPSLDSTHMMAEAILRQVKPTMGKIDPKAAEKVDAFIRASYPQWPGILNPAEAEAFLKHKEVGKRTSTILQALDKADAVRGGLPNLGAARLAVMDPRLVSADQLSSGFAISRLDPSARGTSVKHGTYTSPMLGDYRGGTDYQIPARLMFPDWYKGMNPEFLEKKSGLMKPTSPTMFQHGLMMQFPLQKTTQEWLDNIMAHTEREGKKWGYREGGVVYE